MQFSVRDFSKRTKVPNILLLKEELLKYKGHSVTIEYKTKRDMTQCVFVSIDNDGIIRESYGDKKIIDFDELNSIADGVFVN